MKVRSILGGKGREVVTIRSDADLLTAAQHLRNKGIGAVVVSEDGVHLDGLVSERDIVVSWAEHPDLLPHRKVRDVMHRSPATCSPDDDLKAVEATMTRHRQRQVPVLEHGRLVGVVSLGDVVRHRLDEADLELRVLRDLSIARS